VLTSNSNHNFIAADVFIYFIFVDDMKLTLYYIMIWWMVYQNINLPYKAQESRFDEGAVYLCYISLNS